ncbi:MAG TPA: hypothetical protein VI229_00360 [Burkholderiales bacterium]
MTPDEQTGASLQTSLDAIEAGNYLGDAALVETLVRGWVGDIMGASTPDDMLEACNRLALIFSGNDPAFTPIPEWSTRDGMGRDFAERLGAHPDQNLVDILRTGLSIVGLELVNVARDYEGQPVEKWGWLVDEKVALLVSLFLGTVAVTHDPLSESGEEGA